MKKKVSIKEKKKIILNYIKKNHQATYKDIRKNTKLHPERLFKSLEEAFKKARIKSPRTFKKKTKEQKRKIITEYIKKHHGVGGQIIAKETKINPSNVFKNIAEAYKSASVKYPREENIKLKKRSKSERKRKIIRLVKENSLINIAEIMRKTRCQPYYVFKNMGEIYKMAGIKNIIGHDKWRLKRRKHVIGFIKDNPLAT